MKVYLYLLSILPIIVTAIPALHGSTHIEHIEKSGLDHKVVKRASPVCNSYLCGMVSINDCVAELENLASDSGGEGSPVCAKNDVVVLGGKCQISFSSIGSGTLCISPKRLSGLANKVFDACVNNPKVATGTGGCIDIEDGGLICIQSHNNILCA